jgi:hypothetical protein
MTTDLCRHNDDARKLIRQIVATGDPAARQNFLGALEITADKVRPKDRFRPNLEAEAIIDAAECYDFLTPDLWTWPQERA